MSFGDWIQEKGSIRAVDRRFWVLSKAENSEKTQFCNLFVEPTFENDEYNCSYSMQSLTFFSVAIHLVIAGTLEPVRSFKARIESLMSKIVAMVSS